MLGLDALRLAVFRHFGGGAERFATGGGLSMVAFGLGGALWLLAAPYAWRWLSGRVSRFRSAWGTRAAGGMLVLVSLWALWMDLIYKPSLWCR